MRSHVNAGLDFKVATKLKPRRKRIRRRRELTTDKIHPEALIERGALRQAIKQSGGYAKRQPLGGGISSHGGKGHCHASDGLPAPGAHGDYPDPAEKRTQVHSMAKDRHHEDMDLVDGFLVGLGAMRVPVRSDDHAAVPTSQCRAWRSSPQQRCLPGKWGTR
eukprot:8387906-Alexandrium_andersonii.AAC.1